MNKVKIRKLEKEEVAEVGKVAERSLKDALKRQNIPQKAIKKILAKRLPVYSLANFKKMMVERAFFVAEENKTGKILGVIALKGNELRTFYVDPGHQRKGIGRLLFNRLKKEAQKKGLKKIVARAHMMVEPAYQALGFISIKKVWEEDEDGRRWYHVWMEQDV